jgi:alpha-tubulin suppressor-like RCC1 family protein
VGALTNWRSVVLSGNQCYAIKTDGTLWVWGWNGDSGVLGLNTSSTTLYYSSPVQVGALTNWKYIRCGDRIPSVMAIMTDGTLWTWGSNDNGQLGLTNRTYYSSPVQVGTLTTWKSVAIYGSTTLAIQDGYI